MLIYNQRNYKTPRTSRTTLERMNTPNTLSQVVSSGHLSRMRITVLFCGYEFAVVWCRTRTNVFSSVFFSSSMICALNCAWFLIPYDRDVDSNLSVWLNTDIFKLKDPKWELHTTIMYQLFNFISALVYS